jgi:hypothetical protein
VINSKTILRIIHNPSEKMVSAYPKFIPIIIFILVRFPHTIPNTGSVVFEDRNSDRKRKRWYGPNIANESYEFRPGVKPKDIPRMKNKPKLATSASFQSSIIVAMNVVTALREMVMIKPESIVPGRNARIKSGEIYE